MGSRGSVKMEMVGVLGVSLGVGQALSVGQRTGWSHQPAVGWLGGLWGQGQAGAA